MSTNDTADRCCPACDRPDAVGEPHCASPSCPWTRCQGCRQPIRRGI